MRCARSATCRCANCSIAATTACSLTVATATRLRAEARVTEARVAVAYSGGRDSTALLHATLRAAAPFGIGVVAMHVHHGLHPNADDWLAHCRRRCERWTQAGHRLHFASERLTTSPRRGESV